MIGAGPVNARRVLVVGASASFGLDLVEGFTAQGAQVLATTRSGLLPGLRDMTGVTGTAGMTGAAGAAGATGAVRIEPLDLLDTASLDRLADSVVPEFGALDVAIFTAGILPGKALSAYDDALMHEVMSANFTSQAALLRRLLPRFNDKAQVLMLSSISADRGSFDPVYAASKAALVAFVKSLATWHAPALRVNALAPALIDDSPMSRAMSAERRAFHLAGTPTARLTTAAEVAAVIVSLCGPAWSNLNGQVIRINGGAHV